MIKAILVNQLIHYICEERKERGKKQKKNNQLGQPIRNEECFAGTDYRMTDNFKGNNNEIVTIKMASIYSPQSEQ